ncbi:ribbon-helix-helix domain-containing protein [Pseudoxanthomonas mexicana]
MRPSFRTVSARVPVELFDRLREAATRNERPMSWIIRQALHNYLDHDQVRNSLEEPSSGLPEAAAGPGPG